MTTECGIKTTDICAPPVLGTRCVSSRGPRAELHPEAPGKSPSCLVQLLGAPGVHPWAGGRLPSSLCLRLPVASPLCPCLSSSVSYKDPVLGFRATPIQEGPHLRSFTPSDMQRTFVQTRPGSQVLGVRTWTAVWGAMIQSHTRGWSMHPHLSG